MVALTKSQNKWGFACGRVSALEARLMPYEFFVSLALLERTEDLFHRLQDTSLREYMVPGAVSWEDWSAIIDTYVNNTVVSLRGDSPSTALADLFTLSEDYLNLKRAVLNRAPFPFHASLFTEARLAEVASGGTSLLPDVIRPAIAQLSGMGAEGQDAAVVDIVLDGAYLRHYLALAAQVQAPLIDFWARERVLSRAITALWRAARAGRSAKPFQQYFLPIGDLNGVVTDLIAAPDPRTWAGLIPGKIGDLFREALEAAEDEQAPRFEHVVGDYLTDIARRTKLQTAGPERVAGFLWGLWVEAFNLKLVISGKLNRIESDALKNRVRETYV